MGNVREVLRVKRRQREDMGINGRGSNKGKIQRQKQMVREKNQDYRMRQ